MCECKNVEIQTYTNQVVMHSPFNNWEVVGIDKCLSGEIGELWQLGVETTGCCCGHNKVRPMINVKPEYHNKMIKLGYKHWVNEFDVDCYEPKSIT